MLVTETGYVGYRDRDMLVTEIGICWLQRHGYVDYRDRDMLVTATYMDMLVTETGICWLQRQGGARLRQGGASRVWSPGSRQCQNLLRHPAGSLGKAPHRQEAEEDQGVALGAAVAAAAALDGAALGETAGTLTKRQSNSLKKAT